MKRMEHAGILNIYINFLVGWKNPDPPKDHSSGQTAIAGKKLLLEDNIRTASMR